MDRAARNDLNKIAVRIIRALDELDVASVAAAENYLSVEKILTPPSAQAPRRSTPGYGFLAENAPFAQACEDAGIVFIGPPGSSIEAMGSKTRARKLMQAAGVPIVPGTIKPVRVLCLGRDRALDRKAALAERAQTLANALRSELSDAQFVEPQGGYFMWVTLPEAPTVGALYQAAADRGVTFVKGTDLLLDGGENTLRLAYSGVTPEQIDAGVARLAEAYGRFECLDVSAPGVRVLRLRAACWCRSGLGVSVLLVVAFS